MNMKGPFKSIRLKLKYLKFQDILCSIGIHQEELSSPFMGKTQVICGNKPGVFGGGYCCKYSKDFNSISEHKDYSNLDKDEARESKINDLLKK